MFILKFLLKKRPRFLDDFIYNILKFEKVLITAIDSKIIKKKLDNKQLRKLIQSFNCKLFFDKILLTI